MYSNLVLKTNQSCLIFYLITFNSYKLSILRVQMRSITNAGMRPLATFLLFIAITGCAIKKPEVLPVSELPTPPAAPEVSTQPVYQAAVTKAFDLIHTKLWVSLDWNKQQLNGKAELWVKPHFYPASTIMVDAKGMDIHKVELESDGKFEAVEYVYDDLKLFIRLGQTFTANDTAKIAIDYTAKPEEIQVKGSRAISSDKGLYFINPQGDDPNKPRQVWTQGETEASSCWFPTLDAPNQKTTQELFVTVDSVFQSLSNGALVAQVENEGGTRTDHWVQMQPHAPYLVALIVGEYAVVKDFWRDSIAVDYFVEPAYREDAMAIFGNTPEMLEFYSTILDYDYPWDKYHQVIVRDFVSGAMENTSAVVHGEFVQRTRRELLDRDFEFIVAHELFHHWFGDLVTCESWANLPLNESFATYGEYLWAEHKYGLDQADFQLRQFLRGYLSESKTKQVDMIRFDYEQREDMFDNHSYDKGGRILHMLRKEIGDDAFFASLNHFLTHNAYQAAEMHDLRLSVEEITGRDMNWFFNQWFFASGHPDLQVDYAFDDQTMEQMVVVNQRQNLDQTPLYRLPIKVAVYTDLGIEQHEIEITQSVDTFKFHTNGTVRWVNFDVDKALLAEIEENKPDRWWHLQFREGQLYADRQLAMIWASGQPFDDTLALDIAMTAAHDPFWGLRVFACHEAERWVQADSAEALLMLQKLAQHDSVAAVRQKALESILEHYEIDENIAVFKRALNDSSYSVMSVAIKAIADHDPKMGQELIARFEDSGNQKIINVIASIYADSASDAQNAFFVDNLARTSRGGRNTFIKHYKKYLVQDGRSLEAFEQGVLLMKGIVDSDSYFWAQVNAGRALQEMLETAEKWSSTDNTPDSERAAKAKSLQQGLQEILDEIMADPKNEKLIKHLDQT